jgi:aminoglycoside 3-N-acetyltransferase
LEGEVVTRGQIAHALNSLGVAGGDLMLVHSSFRSFGGVEGGPQTVVQGMMDAVSPGGSVFVPTFTSADVAFDPRSTTSQLGAITEVLRTMPGAVRSLHPTHSMAGLGPEAEEILSGHEQHDAFGPESPLWRLWKRNAWVLLIGVRHNASSMIHVAEEVLQIPYIRRSRTARIATDQGMREVVVRRPGCSKAFNRVDPILRNSGKIAEFQVGDSRLMLMRSADVVDAAASMLRADPAALLCDKDDGGVCDEARRML